MILPLDTGQTSTDILNLLGLKPKRLYTVFVIDEDTVKQTLMHVSISQWAHDVEKTSGFG